MKMLRCSKIFCPRQRWIVSGIKKEAYLSMDSVIREPHQDLTSTLMNALREETG